LLAVARRLGDSGDWQSAIRLYRQAEAAAPDAPELKHSLALAYYAIGNAVVARTLAAQATTLNPALWQSHAIIARIEREQANPAASEAAWRRVLTHVPDNGTALLGLADLAMNEFGDPAAAIELVAPLASQSHHAVDAELTTLMALLYTGDVEAEILSERLCAFSRANLRLPRYPERRLRSGRRRIGLISPLFNASPVYHLTVSTWTALRARHDLIVFDRGTRVDWATERLRALAAEWVSVTHLTAAPLAQRIAAAEIDVLFDLGGWSDVVGLAALSTKPAARMYKWVGGQSATTGLDMFDGWIGDAWQSPPALQPLYAEPIINLPGGYVDYQLPDVIRKYAGRSGGGAALVGNPAKIAPATLAAWPDGVEEVTLIDRRYAHDRTRARVTNLLAQAGIGVEAVITPSGHEDYVAALARHAAIINTQPYAAGLTAIEAHLLGLRVLGKEVGKLFASRHHLSHAQTHGQNESIKEQLENIVGSSD
jgi:predicted O-linked N-acetylglucosamine transferase (SPINDLY family)